MAHRPSFGASCGRTHIRILRSKRVLITVSRVPVALDERDFCFPRVVLVPHEIALRQPGQERQQIPILFGRLALAICFAAVPSDVRVLPAAGTSSRVASCVFCCMRPGRYRLDSEERATRPYGNRSGQWRAQRSCGGFSDYLNGDLPPELLVQIESHLVQCRRCTAVFDGTRNVLMLLIHPTIIALPAGFSQRLYERMVMSSGVRE
jgi:hypothetical protein